MNWVVVPVIAIAMATMLGGCSGESRPYLNLYVCEQLVSSPDQPGEVQIISVICPPDEPREIGR
jgi:hypothetical protein